VFGDGFFEQFHRFVGIVGRHPELFEHPKAGIMK
jgi:hypothetical protein